MKSPLAIPLGYMMATAVAGLVVLVFWFLYISGGLPMTTVDDLYFFGIADSLSRTGLLESRYMTSEYLSGLPSNDFFFQPPIYPAVFATWLFFWPASELSVQTFAFAAILIGIAGIIVITRQLRVGVSATAIICAVYVLSFSRLGLRPEVLSVSLLIFGTGLLLMRRPVLVPLGLLSYGTSILCYPFTLPGALAFTLFSFIYWPNGKPNKWALFAVFGTAVVALLVFVNLSLISWRLAEFLDFYRRHVEVVNPGTLFTLDRYVAYVGKLSTDSKFLPKLPFVLIGPCLLVWASVFRQSSPVLRRFCWAFTFGVFGAAGMAHLRSVDLSIFYSLAVSAMILDTSLQRPLLRLAGQLVVVGLALIANIAVVASVALQTSLGDVQIQEIRTRAAAVPSGHRILVDSSAARHVFNWQLGNNAFDFRTSRQLLAPFGTNFYPRNLNEIRDDEVWIVGRDFSYSTETPGITPKPVTVMGKALGSVGSRNCDPLFITRKNGLVVVE